MRWQNDTIRLTKRICDRSRGTNGPKVATINNERGTVVLANFKETVCIHHLPLWKAAILALAAGTTVGECEWDEYLDVNQRSHSSVISDVKSVTLSMVVEEIFFYCGNNSEMEANPYVGQVVTDTTPDEEHVSPTCPNRVVRWSYKLCSSYLSEFR
ncbi:hypothetical protein Tco_0957922 [Tanacetum coccineum]